MDCTSLPSLASAFAQVTDPRARRGRRHSLSAVLSLVFLALLARVSDFASMRRWAQEHWSVLGEPLGFTRPAPPHPTTLSRLLARVSPGEFQALVMTWLGQVLTDPAPTVAAVDGKTSKQAQDAAGHPLQMLHVFVQDLKACVAQWPLAGDKRTEPEVLKAHLSQLAAAYPGLRLLTGDALFTQRNLAELVVEAGQDYLLQIKANQPDLQEAARTCLGQAESRPADHEVREKKEAGVKYVVFGSTWTTPTMFGSGWVLPVAVCCCASIDAGGKRTLGSRKRATTSPASPQNKRRRPS